MACVNHLVFDQILRRREGSAGLSRTGYGLDPGQDFLHDTFFVVNHILSRTASFGFDGVKGPTGILSTEALQEPVQGTQIQLRELAAR